LETPSETPAATPAQTSEVIAAAAVAAPVETPPEDYEIELSEDSPLSDEDLQVISDYASENNLTKEQADKLITLKESAYKKGEATFKSAEEKKVLDARTQLLADPEFSGDAAKVSWESVSRAVETFGDQSTIELLNTPGIGDNIVLARFLKKIGDMLRPDDNTPQGKGVNTPGPKDGSSSHLQRMYPEYFEKK
jgi:hypothetical protein